MTYSSLVAFTMFTRIMYGSYMCQPYQPQYLNKITKNVILDLLNESNTQLLLNGNVTFYWNLILILFYNELGYILFLTRLLKEKYMNPSKVNEIPTNSNLGLISKSKLDNKDDNFSILDCQSHILYITNYIIHYLNSLEYFNPANKSKLDNNKSSSAIDYLNITLMECYLIIHYGIRHDLLLFVFY
ncbi:hypothetical protein K502DRAFT_349944 [Neoconidiobolus thromboides FSU 785]|nr:hypothetical protein K502DRAFT_349944 [Neoconidiobolus thromboides FSU 785]